MRGKVSIHALSLVFPGITPAYAGKSFATISSDAPFRDHPRLCGEKRLSLFSKGFISRITPAYAGKRYQMFAWHI